MTFRTSLIVPLVCACTLSACTSKNSDVAPAPSPILSDSARLIIHPLTRVGADPQGDSVLALHFTFQDDAAAPLRPLGSLRVEIYRPKPTPDAPQPIDKSWTVDLSDPAKNAAAFDEMITRTYSVNLGGVPDWLAAWSRGDGASAPTLVAVFTPATPGQASLRSAIPLTR